MDPNHTPSFPPIVSSPLATSPFTDQPTPSHQQPHQQQHYTPAVTPHYYEYQHADPNLILPRPTQPLAYWHSTPSPYSPNVIQSGFQGMDGLLHGSPVSMYAPLPRRSSEVPTPAMEEDPVKKRKRASMPSVKSTPEGSSTAGPSGQVGSDEEGKGKSRSTSGGLPNLTSKLDSRWT